MKTKVYIVNSAYIEVSLTWAFFFADYDDYLDDDDLDLIEENLGVKVKRRVIIDWHY